ncbi:M6 family metalloprotease domain-containing protein [Clostridium oryzae]|uniref:Immune inhibitor A peptidase M6 n=1 Tax=Clostridium oryzae TaxID=1450648 RepID=A0A1V4IH07_9CLOT|nr:M6 family metalloprotease domain-containing protein [Clostridium oryzae]OPJ59233.1 immune inhibitor A peptidase M6 [Clostridium oryzae]
MAIYPIKGVHSYTIGLLSTKQASPIGSLNNIVIFIRFRDDKEFEASISKYEDMFNKSEQNYNSVYNYYKEVSYNKLIVNSTFYPLPQNSKVVSYKDSKSRCYYEPRDCKTNPEGYEPEEQGNREAELLVNAINAVKSQIPVSLNIDTNNDGNVDNICFIIKGEAGSWGDLLWPHMSSLYDKNVFINGKRVAEYNFNIESMANTGVICHEMGHSIGFPDLYHYSNSLDPVGPWDIMSSDPTPPPHTSARLKNRYGKWIDNIPEISGKGPHTLNPLTSDTNNAYKIASPVTSNEYFIAEYRKRNTTFEKSLPGEGLIIYRIKPDLTGNSGGPPDEVFVCRQGTSSDDPYGGNVSNANLNKLVNRTTLGGKYNPILLSDGTNSGLIISNVSEALDTISFEIGTTADLSIEMKLLSTSPLYVGQPLKYMLTVKNNGPDDAKNVVVVNPIKNYDFTKTIIDNNGFGIWDPYSGGIIGMIDLVPSGQSFNVTITVIPTSTDFIIRASIKSDTYDPNIDNNRVEISPELVEKADLSITSKVLQDIIYENDIIEYELAVKNNGPSPSREVSIIDLLPLEVRYISVETDWLGEHKSFIDTVEGKVSISIDKLEAQEEVKFRIKVKVLEHGTITNKATVQSDAVFDPNLSNNETVLTTTVVNKFTTGPIWKRSKCEKLLVVIQNTTNERVRLILYNKSLDHPHVDKYPIRLNRGAVSRTLIRHVSDEYEITIDRVPKGVYVSIFIIHDDNYSNKCEKDLRCVEFYKHTELINTNR